MLLTGSALGIGGSLWSRLVHGPFLTWSQSGLVRDFCILLTEATPAATLLAKPFPHKLSTVLVQCYLPDLAISK